VAAELFELPRGRSTVPAPKEDMAPPPDKSRAAEPALWAFAVSLVLLAGPVRALWATPERGWAAPFLVWVVVIAIGAWAVHRASTPS